MTAMITIAVCALALSLTTSPASAFNEPTDLRGVPWGATQEETDKIHRARDEAPWCQGTVCWIDKLIGPVMTKIIYGFQDGRFTNAVIHFKPTDYATLRDIFIARYGPPTHRADEPYQTKGGLKTTNEVVRWVGPKVMVEIKTYGRRIDEGRAALILRESIDRSMKDRGKDIQKGKGDL